MLLKCQKKTSRYGMKNVFPVNGKAEILPFSEESFDVVYMVTVLGEITDKQKCVELIKRVIKKGGILSITEMKGDPDLLSPDQLNKLVLVSGFEYLETFTTQKGFTINYKSI
jgi:ubiquinone/menaquinone biosynthesis C-methylase UbiE